MNAVDTNVLIYRIDSRDPVKQLKARNLVRQLRSASDPMVLLWQVLGEFPSQLRRWESQGMLGRSSLVRYLI